MKIAESDADIVKNRFFFLNLNLNYLFFFIYNINFYLN